jgi:short-subunit dehydrogenase
MVACWMQGLQHRAAGTGVRIVLIKPGPTDTPMTASLKAQGRVKGLASVEDVSAAIVRGVDRGTPVVYAPGKWAVIMMVIRHLPRFVFDRMDI